MCLREKRKLLVLIVSMALVLYWAIIPDLRKTDTAKPIAETVWMENCTLRLSLYQTLDFPRGLTIGKSATELSLSDCALYESRYLHIENSKLIYLGIPKSFSSSTATYLQQLGETLGDPFVIHRVMHVATNGCTNYPNMTQIHHFLESMKHKTVFTVVRPVPDRVDSAAGTVLNRLSHLIPPSETLNATLVQSFENLVTEYNQWQGKVDAVPGAQWSSSGLRPMHHLLPQVFFLTNIPADVKVFLSDDQISSKIEDFVITVFANVSRAQLPIYPLVNKNEGGITTSFWNWLQNHPDYLNAYRFDMKLIELAREQRC